MMRIQKASEIEDVRTKIHEDQGLEEPPRLLHVLQAQDCPR